MTQGRFAWVLLIGVMLVGAGRAALAESQAVVLRVQWDKQGPAIPDDFCGLSFETKMILPGSGGAGKYFFRADNAPLIAMFQSLGVKNLRIGGNSADAPEVKIPTPADVDSLYAFAKAADVGIIFNLRLKATTQPAAAPLDQHLAGDVALAKYIMDHDAAQTVGFTIGNEPNMYFTEYPAYRDTWRKFADAIRAAAPESKFVGPSATPGKTAWARDFANDIGPTGMLALLSQHAYPGGNAQKVESPAAARELVLSEDIDRGYQKFHDVFVPAAKANHLRYRLEESNSLFHGGAPGVSNAFASALWGLDFMEWWAAHDAAGINFHTGNRVARSETEVPGGYDIFWTGPGGFKVHPMGYALKAFALAGAGRSVPIDVGHMGPVNMSAYGVLKDDRALYLTVLNRTSGAAASEAAITLHTERGGGPGAAAKYTAGEMVLLASPQNDIAQVTGTTLGGAAIDGEGKWAGTWTKLDAPKDGAFTITLPASTAAVIRLTTN